MTLQPQCPSPDSAVYTDYSFMHSYNVMLLCFYVYVTLRRVYSIQFLIQFNFIHRVLILDTNYWDAYVFAPSHLAPALSNYVEHITEFTLHLSASTSKSHTRSLQHCQFHSPDTMSPPSHALHRLHVSMWLHPSLSSCSNAAGKVLLKNVERKVIQSFIAKNYYSF